MKAGKIWGTTELVEANCALEFHRIEMKKGGIMKVSVWQKDYDLIDETILKPGDYTKVKPGLYHQFECIESGVAFELYWATFNHDDIVRETVGKMKK